MYEFRWNDWNVDHIAEHGVEPEEAECVVNTAMRPFPQRIDGDKRIVKGATRGGRFIQVVYVFDRDGTVFVIHARSLTPQEQRQLRRRRR